MKHSNVMAHQGVGSLKKRHNQLPSGVLVPSGPVTKPGVKQSVMPKKGETATGVGR